MLVRAFVGFDAEKSKQRRNEAITQAEVPSAAIDAMNQSALQYIASRAAPGSMPIKRGKDTGLPKKAPVFDIAEMRRRNEAVSRRLEFAQDV